MINQIDIDVNSMIENLFTPIVIGLLIIFFIGIPLLKKVLDKML